MHLAKSKQKQKVRHPQFVFNAIGTQWTIDINCDLSPEVQNSLLLKVTERIEEFDKTYSRFRNDSLIHTISEQAGAFIFPKDFLEMISLYKKMYEITDGLMTPLIGNVLEQAGYDKEYSLEKKELKVPDRWDEVLKVEGNTLIVTKPVTLDFGAIGKGYLIDIVGNILLENNVNSFCIDAGGDMLIKNQEMTVGFEDPENSRQIVGTLNTNNSSICASAGNRRKWGDLHHIFNPKTLEPVSDIIAVWVKAESAIVADALTTALFFADPEKITSEFDFEYLIINKDYSYKSSQLFPSNLYVV